MTKIVVRTTLILLTASLFLSLWFWLAPSVTAQSRLIGMVTPPVTQFAPGCPLRDEMLVLVGTESEVPLFSTPDGPQQGVAPTGTRVRVVDCTVVAGKGWYLVELPNRAKGWAEAATLRRPAAPATVQKVEISRFTLCEGTRVGPSTRCGLELARDVEAFWLAYTYAGILPNDIVQTQIEINGETYQGRPKPWTGPEAGRHLVSLADIPAPRVAGTWVVQVSVNGYFAGAISVRVR